MRLSSSAPGSSLGHMNAAKSGSCLRKKRKRLDAICEDEYNRNHGELNECDDASVAGVRRSSRVRRAPVVLDASPAPPKRRRKLGKNRMLAGHVKGVKQIIEHGGRNSGGGDAESPGTWRSRLRSRGSRNVGFRVKEEKESTHGKRKLFKGEVGSKGDRELEVDEKEEFEGGMPRIVKSKRPGRIKATKHEEGCKENESQEEGHKENDSHEEGHEESESHEEGLEVSESDQEGHEESESDQEVREESESSEEGREESESSEEGHEESESCEEGHEESESQDEGNKENVSHQENRENEYHVSLDENKSQVVDHMLNKDEESSLVLEIDEPSRNLVDLLDKNDPSVVGNEERNLSSKFQAKECSGGIEQSLVENVEKQDDRLECVKEGNNGSDTMEFAGISRKQVENEGSVDKEVDIDENALKDANILTKDAAKQASIGAAGRPRIKEGRRCGLCGGGTDGKPPKQLLQDNGESENEAYSGSSASEEPNYDIWDGFSDDCGWLGNLLGPINDNYGIARIWVHQQCAVWSPEVYFAGLGCLKNVRAALCRGRALKCTRCGRRGATSGCRVDRCPKTYHLPCARASGCIFDHRKFLIACTDHRHLFEPHGNRYLARMKKLRARKMKWEMRKHSNEASRNDIAAEERWLENCGEDEEFLKRENKRLHRDLLRIAPVYIGGPDSASEPSIQGWESVAGLKDVIQCMKEVVILPLLYPELFGNLGLTPPRGVLLHGYPGTGKTLVVRALIGACARGDERIAYFARKGADCLGKYVGDAERQLRLLFQVAEKCQPSIIFFDEIDGLAPCRTRQQDQTHSSVVSTLLALMDGLKSRGSVVVIGATNRPEAVDPALRRPGRFDREIYFPLPSIEDRASILSLHTQRWPKPITGSLLDWIARKTPGYAGADLQALCTQVAINALKRNFPLQEIMSLAEESHSGWKHLPLPSFAVEERDWLEAFSRSPLPCSRREAGNAANDVASSPLPIHLIPCLLRPLCSLLVTLCLDELPWLPPPLFKAVTVIKNTMVSALEKRKMPIDHWWLHVDDFLQETNIASEVRSKLACLGLLSANDGFASCLDIMDDKDGNKVNFEPSINNHVGMRRGLFPNKSLTFTNKSGFRILISGNPQSGQRHLASSVLYCFMGNIEMQKIDMATMSQEGHGDIVQGISQILMRCASVQSCILFMPRIDLWAVEKHFQVSEKTDSFSINHLFPEMDKSFKANQVVGKKSEFNIEKNSAEITKGQAKASHAWMSFIEQVESIGVSTSLMILATSEVPYSELPRKIREFFKSYQSKDTQSTPLEQNVHRFSLQLDGNFDRDVMFSLSVRELLRNVVEQEVQLIHWRSHVHICVQKGYRTFESMEICKDKVHQSKDDGPGDEKKDEIQLTKSLTKVPPPPNSRSLKDKSTMLSAISTFGCQILLYPHFGELCWVTSKLKEGPCADVNGSWRSWPFNSCVIRPSNSLDKVAVSCSSGSIKGKERSGVVRGLIAVGLLAYRGVYKSAREVSHDVRKVFEILIQKINAKIQDGNDRYQYLRILSQVAYLEDTVNNWAYSLTSSEQDSPEVVSKGMPASVGSSGGEDPHLVVPMNCDDSETPERNCQGIPAETTGSPPAMNENNDNIDNLDCDSEGSLPNHSADKHSNNFVDANQPVDPSPNQENANPAGVSDSVTARNHVLVGGEVGVSEDMNNSTHTQTGVLSENGFTAGKLEDVGRDNSSTVSNQPLNMSSTDTGVKLSNDNFDKPENAMDTNVSSDNGDITAEPGIICIYRCCTGCLHSLYDAIHKLLARELSSSHWTVEDVHDAVSSLSVDLISAVRKCHMEKGFGNLCSKTFRHEEHAKTLNMETGDPGNRDKDIFVPCECVSPSHSTTDKVLNESQKLDLKFIFKDGVLVPVDPDKDSPLHCKFENLCLCSVTELIVVTKHPFD